MAVRSHAEGGAASGEAAGLVISKTSAIGDKSNLQSLKAGEAFELSFSKENQTRARLKRMRKGVWLAGTCHSRHQNGFRADDCWFVTLTYRGVQDWRPDHLSAAMAGWRSHCKRAGIGCRYVWVAELQNRGAVHYHLIVWTPKGARMPKWDLPTTTASGREVGKLWAHGMTNRQRAKNGVGYLMKYLSKMGELHTFPDGLRLHGSGGLQDYAKQVRTWYNLPEWVKREYGVGDVKRRGGRLIVMDSGEILEPMFSRHIMPGGMVLKALRDYPEKRHDGPYSTFLQA